MELLHIEYYVLNKRTHSKSVKLRLTNHSTYYFIKLVYQLYREASRKQ